MVKKGVTGTGNSSMVGRGGFEPKGIFLFGKPIKSRLYRLHALTRHCLRQIYDNGQNFYIKETRHEKTGYKLSCTRSFFILSLGILNSVFYCLLSVRILESIQLII